MILLNCSFAAAAAASRCLGRIQQQQQHLGGGVGKGGLNLVKHKLAAIYPGKSSSSSSSSSADVPRLLKRGNIGLFRLLVIVNDTGSGITTFKLLKALGSIGRAQGYIKRAEREGLITRKEGESEHGQFAPVYNFITPKGTELLKKV